MLARQAQDTALTHTPAGHEREGGGGNDPRYRQIYEDLREAIASGVLKPGERLPSTRALAARLGAARGTVDLAYSLLSSEGYIVGRGSAGSFVSSAVDPAQLRNLAGRATPPPAAVAVLSPQQTLKPFQLGLPALDAFPAKVWSRIAGRHARRLPASSLLVPDALGHPPLRLAVSQYLALARGISCNPGQVIITSGFQAALGLVTRALVGAGDAVWLEDPGYHRARHGLDAAGAVEVPVPVDHEGLMVEAGVERSPGARLAIVTPSHQAPLGMTLSLPRRLALLDWAERSGSWILEDDYDGEFRYTSKPVPALKSLDRMDRVLYVGSFSKVLFPGLRLGYLVVPTALSGKFQTLCEYLYRDRPLASQQVVTDFITEGHFYRHIRRMRALYAERRAALVEAIRNTLSGEARLELHEGGMHLLLRLRDDEDDRQYVERARAKGLAPVHLSLWTKAAPDRGVLLSFTNIPASLAAQRFADLRRAIWE
jgi:GntR family transcriptional regulator/MocR family aminotransferase